MSKKPINLLTWDRRKYTGTRDSVSISPELLDRLLKAVPQLALELRRAYGANARRALR